MRSHDQTLKEMNDNRLLFEQIVSNYPEPAISHRPGEHNWSIKEILCHLADIQELVLGRVQKMLAEENPSIELYDEERENRERDHRDDDMGLAKANFVSTREIADRRAQGRWGFRLESHGPSSDEPRFHTSNSS